MNLEMELRACQVSAEEGYKLASAKYDEIKHTLTDAAKRLSKADSEQNKISRIQNTTLVETQQNELRRLTDRVTKIREDIKLLRKRSKNFSIVVYGRTMAGKSTLMEILTHGNGKSIGKGAQRTTLDVRNYFWNGLKITDVPGICAFGGEEDERLALEAAKSADLILFLLTSDAPQPDEAACLAQLKNFGKPILGVVNVKMNFNMNDELDVEDLQDKLNDTETIDAIIKQFKNFSANHNQDWSGIKFVATHLLSAYQSQDNNPKIFKLSRFAEVENFIVDKVRADGSFLRIKTFADSVAVPMSDIILKIYEQSAKTLTESDIWLDKRRQLLQWREKFLERSREKLLNLHNNLKSELEAAIYDFAECHYEDKNVNENWQQHFQSLKFDEKYQNLLRDLAQECERKRNELSDELTQELSYVLCDGTRTKIELESTTPWGQYISTVVGIAGIIFTPLVFVGILGNFFFDGRATQIRQAKEKLRNDLTAASHEVLDKMRAQAVEIFNKEILAKGINEFSNLLAGYQFMLARLGKSQSDMAATLFKEFSDLNAKLLEEAIYYKGAGMISFVDKIARVPGENLVAFAERAKLNLDELSDLLGEKLIIKKPHKNIFETVREVLDSKFNLEEYPLDFSRKDEKTPKTFSFVLKQKVDATKFKIAQQIAGVPIITR